jgi:hypothetical protein
MSSDRLQESATMSNSDELRRCVQGLLDFIIEQLELAKSPSGQLAGVDAAGGVMPYLRSKLSEDRTMAANVALAFPFGRYAQPDSEGAWRQLADESPDTFAKSASKLISCIQTLKAVI